MATYKFAVNGKQQTVDELASIDVAHHTTLALPFNHGAFNPARFRPTIEIGVEILNALLNDCSLFVFSQLVIDANLHRPSLSHKNVASTIL